MKKSLLVALCVLLTATLHAQQKDWAQFARYKQANTTAAKGAKALFMGNSITDGWARATTFFNDNLYLGRGISGQTTSEMLVRFRADVLNLQPKCVVILAGTNDIAQNNGTISLDNILGNIISMAELALAHKIEVIICSVLPVYQYKWRPEIEEPAQKIMDLNAMLKEYANKNKMTYADYHSAMKDERNGLPEKYSADGVHPNAAGYAIMQSIIKPIIDKRVR